MLDGGGGELEYFEPLDQRPHNCDVARSKHCQMYNNRPKG